MGQIRFFLLVLITGALFGAGSLFLRFQTPLAPSDLHLVASTSTNYLGPDKPVVGNPKLVRVEVLVRDAVEPAGVQILSVEFNGTSIPLQPRDIYGNRGAGSFQLPPGKYKLKWKVNRDTFAWPRNLSHEEIVEVSPRDLWVQITIDGDSASIR